MGDVKLKISQGIKIHIELDFEDMIADGFSRGEAIRKIAKNWQMSIQEVSDIINVFEHEMNDIDHTGDLGEIL